MFVCENRLVFPIFVRDQKSKSSIDLLLKVEEGTIEFKNYFKQIPVPSKIYADFECNLKNVESYEGSYSENIKITFLVVLLTNLFVLTINLPSQYLFLEVKMLLIDLLKQFLRIMNTVKK